MLENNLGLTVDKGSTNPHAVLSTNRKMSPEEYQIVQNEVDFIYSEFLNRVSEGRGMSLDQVNEVARGRVWTGTDALRVGLVDTLDRKSTRLNSSHVRISYAVFCLKKTKIKYMLFCIQCHI